MEPGLHQMTADTYHDDPCPEPSLSASLAHVLLTCSPRHAWWAHPRLNPAFEPDRDEKFDLGTAAHAYLLQGASGFAVLDFPDWRTKAAKEARDAARDAGKVPLLAFRWADVQAMAAAAQPQLDAHEDPPRPLAGGAPEQTLVWQEGDVWCRARLDWLHHDRQTVDDYKTTGGSANPEMWTRGPLFTNGYDLQAAFYLRGLQVLYGIAATFRFVVQENTAPFALSVIGLSPGALVLAEKKRLYAVDLWRSCLATNRWPAYPTRTCWAELPPWLEAAWLERELRPVDDGRPIAELMTGDL